MIFGIDYGSKLAGTTAIAYVDNGKIKVQQSAKKQDADSWISEQITLRNASLIAIDAPLSLPSVYKGSPSSDYFYRACDTALKAMSPMFLGGLTARAIRLKDSIDIPCIEVYPKALVVELFSSLEAYKKSTPTVEQIGLLSQYLPHPIEEQVFNWHQFDAVLAWLSGYRYTIGQAKPVGDPKEGQIYV